MALLLRMANDVGENPGPTLLGIVDPTKVQSLVKLMQDTFQWTVSMLVNNVWLCP